MAFSNAVTEGETCRSISPFSGNTLERFWHAVGPFFILTLSRSVKPVEVPRFGFAIVAPRCFLYAGKHHSLIRARRFLLRPDVPIPIFRIWIGARLLEPGVLIGGMVHYQVDQDTDAALFCAVSKLDEIA